MASLYLANRSGQQKSASGYWSLCLTLFATVQVIQKRNASKPEVVGGATSGNLDVVLGLEFIYQGHDDTS